MEEVLPRESSIKYTREQSVENITPREWYSNKLGTLLAEYRKKVLTSSRLVFCTLSRLVKNDFYYEGRAYC